MTSNDMNSYIREDVFNARMDKIEAINERDMAIINSKFSETKAEIHVLDSRIDNFDNRFDDAKNFMSTGFCVIAILVALIPYFNYRKERIEEKKKNNSFVTVEQVQNIVDEAISKAIGRQITN